MKTQAQQFLEAAPIFDTFAKLDVSALMGALDRAEVESNQNWESETTTWTFPDGSFISVSGTDVQIGQEAA